MAMTARDRRALVILGVVLAAALAAYFLLLRPGNGDPAAQGTATPTATGSATPEPTPTRTRSPRPSPSSSGIPVAAKDPFSPLVTPGGDGDGGPTDGGNGTTSPVPTATDGGTSPAPTGTDGTTSPAPTGTDGTTSPAPTGTTSPAPTGTGPTPTGTGTPTPSVSPPTSDSPVPGGGTSIVIGGHEVTLIDLFERDNEEMAQVVVDGDGFTVTEGETFAENFRLVSIGSTCASFLFGDEQFVLCENPQK